MKTLLSAALTLSFLSPLALTACAEAETGETAATEEMGNELTDDGDTDTAPVTAPEGEIDPDGAGPDEAYGDSGTVDAETTDIPETGEVQDIPGTGGEDGRITGD